MTILPGMLNQVARTTKFIKFYKDYRENNVLEEGDNSFYNPNVLSSSNPFNNDNDTNCIKLGRNSDCLTYGNIKPEFQSGMIIIDPDLKLLAAISNERDLLYKAGLHIDPTDDVRIVKTSTGDVKAAIAIGSKRNGQIKYIKYIDIDEDSINFHKAISKLASQPNSPLQFYENEVDVQRYDINQKSIKE